MIDTGHRPENMVRKRNIMEKTFSGKTAEEAVEAGLKELGLTRDDVEIEVLEEGKKRLFGSIPAQVKLTVKEKLTDGQRAVKFLEGLLPLIGTEAAPTLAGEDEKIVIELQADGAKGIIGRRGEVIDAIQVLAGAVANTGRHEYKRVVVDCGNYREEREETLKRVAEKLAAKAVRLRKRVRLEPMNPYERRIIHSALANSEEVFTKSEGKEPNRFVVITPKNMKQDDRRGGRKNAKDRPRREGPKYGGERKKTYEHRDLPSEATPESSGTSFSRGGTPGYKKGGFSGFFGTFLGNANDEETKENEAPSSPTDEE